MAILRTLADVAALVLTYVSLCWLLDTKPMGVGLAIAIGFHALITAHRARYERRSEANPPLSVLGE